MEICDYKMAVLYNEHFLENDNGLEWFIGKSGILAFVGTSK